MSMGAEDRKKLHYELTNVGLRAQATAVGLVQLCIELKQANVLDEGAVDRVKSAIADEIAVCASRPVDRKDYRQEVRNRLDKIFSGEQRIGTGDELSPS